MDLNIFSLYKKFLEEVTIIIINSLFKKIYMFLDIPKINSLLVEMGKQNLKVGEIIT